MVLQVANCHFFASGELTPISQNLMAHSQVGMVINRLNTISTLIKIVIKNLL